MNTIEIKWRKTGDAAEDYRTIDIPILIQAGDWAGHRCPQWHAERSWATGVFAPIDLNAKPGPHKRACQAMQDAAYACRTVQALVNRSLRSGNWAFETDYAPATETLRETLGACLHEV